MSNEGTTLYLGAFVDELVRSGLRHIVISPGSRSTPIAILAAEHPELKVWVQIDERSAAFFALGIAKKYGETVALLCTSGTAAANYYPAITEANLSRVPLVVLTADRPHELRDVGAPQTINQIDLYSGHVKWFMEMPIPDYSPTMIRHARVMASRAMITSMTAPRGVVHLNFPLREPLLPNLDHDQLFVSGRREQKSYAQTYTQQRSLSVQEIERLANKLIGAGHAIIICGPHDDSSWTESIVKLAEQLNIPIFADPLSHMRSGQHCKTQIIDSYDSLLKIQSVVEAMKPQLFIRLGAMPVSKPLLQYMNKYDSAEHIIIDEAGWRDPTLLISDYVIANPVVCSEQLRAYIANKGSASEQLTEDVERTHWLQRWQQLEQQASQVLHDAVWSSDFEQCFEGSVVAYLQHMMTEGSTLFVGNSMPIRDVDSFWRKSDKSVTILANRGANGIDGLVSTALGASINQRNNVLLIGDLSFYHDLNGLLAAKLHQLHLTIVIINNDGGGIFSFLPQASMPNHFEALFGTPIGLNYEHAASLYEGGFKRIHHWNEFANAFASAQEQGGLQIIEVMSDRELNVKLHRQIWPKIEQRIQEG